MIDEKYYRIFYPKQVLLITTCDRDGKPNIATIAWHMPVSVEPPLIAVAIGKARHTKKLIEATNEFVLNIVPESLKQQAKLCGSVSGKRTDKFGASALTPEPSMQVKPPSIKECLANIECKVVSSYDASDHVIYIGEVVHIKQSEKKEGEKIRVLVDAEDELSGYEKP